MPTASQHQSKADKNRRFLETVDVAAYPEWVATVAFYVVVHRVEHVRAAAAHGDSTNHADRLSYVQAEHRAIYDPFRQLYDVSRLARYGETKAFFRQFTAEDVTDTIVGQWLAAVEKYAAERIAAHEEPTRWPPAPR